MSRIRLAVVGAGKLGGYHANVSSDLETLDLVAVVDPMEAARNALAEKTGCKAVAETSELFGKIDAAVVATPTFTHRDTVLPLLEAGIHVLVEKPIATTEADATAMVEAAEKAGCTLQVGHVERFSPALTALPTPISEPRFIQATRTSGFTFRSTDIGAVLDLMIHDIDLALSFAKSEVIDVRAMGLSVLGSAVGGDQEDMVTADLTFASGCVARLTASRVSYELQREMQVFGSDGFVTYDFAKGTATSVRPNAEVLSRTFDPASIPAERQAELFAGKLFEDVLVKEEHAAPAVNAIKLELRDFARAIGTGESPRVSGAAGRDAVAVAERILQSVAQHRWDGNTTGRIGAYAEVAASELRKSA